MGASSKNDTTIVRISNDNTHYELSANKAPSSAAFQGWMRPARRVGYTVSQNEITSLSAMIAYVAHLSGDSEFRVGRRLADRFSVANVTCLPADQFDSALRYLVDGLDTPN